MSQIRQSDSQLTTPNARFKPPKNKKKEYSTHKQPRNSTNDSQPVPNIAAAIEDGQCLVQPSKQKEERVLHTQQSNGVNERFANVAAAIDAGQCLVQDSKN
mmetsp:Transcript_17706/g.30082  ORF Transcript_17706/g.30082 Transcript_17706/m.30082 type:complete len:101 (-) Transcript_17706:76-378(-)